MNFEVAYNRGIKEYQINEIIAFLRENYNEINTQIDNTFKGLKATMIINK